MPLTTVSSQGSYNIGSYTNLVVTAITGLTGTFTAAGQIVLTWSGATGNNVKYSYAVSTGTIKSISGQNPTTITLTSTSVIATTVTLTAAALASSVSSSVNVTINTTITPTITGWTNGTDVSGTSVYNGIIYQVYSFQPSLAPGAANKSYTLSYNLTTPTYVYVLAVGGGGGGSFAGGGAGGVVMQSVNLLASANGSTFNTITVNVGAGGTGSTNPQQSYGNTGSNTTISFSTNASANITAWGGGGGGGANYQSTSTALQAQNGGSGGGGSNEASAPYINGGLCTNQGNNYGNQGGLGGVGACGGGGGAGVAGTNDQGGNIGGKGGSGIQCFLPGIATFAPSGSAYGNYYWGGGGTGSLFGYNAADYIKSTGGLGGGGGGGVSSTGTYTSNSGAGGSGGLNIGGNGSTSSGGNAGANTGGGGGGGWLNVAGGAGGSGIVIIAFPQTAITSNAQAVLPSTLFSSGKAVDVLSYDTTFNGTKTGLLSAGAYASIKGAFSCKLVNYNYFGPIMTLRHSADTYGMYTQNFYADVSGNLGTQYLGTGQSVSAWLTANGANTTYAYVTKWYGQGMDLSFNAATQYTLGSQPVYEVPTGLINFGYTTGYTTGTNLPSWSANAGNAWLSLPNGALPTGDASYSYVVRTGNMALTGTTYGIIISSNTTWSTNGFALLVGANGAFDAVETTTGGTVHNSPNNFSYTAGSVFTLKYASTGNTTSNYWNTYLNDVVGNGTTLRGYTGSHGSGSTNGIGMLMVANNSFFNAQLYNLYVFQSSLAGPGTGTDQVQIEATPYIYTAPAAITGLTTSSVTGTNFALSCSAVTNAVNYVIYVNSAYYSTVAAVSNALPLTTITPGYYGSWTVNVYAYNASNLLLASAYLGVSALATPITGLTVSSITSSGCILTWSGGSGTSITYTYTSVPAGATSVSTSSPATITGLAASTTYTITVNAQQGGVTAQSATTISFSTPAPPALYAGSYLAASATGNILYSTTNGTTWTSFASTTVGASGFNIAGIAAAGNNLMMTNVAGTTGYLVNMTTKGVTTFTQPVTGTMWVATNGTGTWVMSGSDGYLYYSTNLGTSWTQATAAGNNFYFNLVYGNGVFVAGGGLGGNSSNTPTLVYSSDGITWTKNTSYFCSNGTTSCVGALFYSKYYNKFFAAGINAGSNVIYSSSNGATWSACTATLTGYGLQHSSPAFGEDRVGKIMLLLSNNTVITSTNGTSFTATSGTGSTLNDFLLDLAYVGSNWVAGGANTAFTYMMTYSTNNGTSWTSQTPVAYSYGANQQRGYPQFLYF